MSFVYSAEMSFPTNFSSTICRDSKERMQFGLPLPPLFIVLLSFFSHSFSRGQCGSFVLHFILRKSPWGRLSWKNITCPRQPSDLHGRRGPWTQGFLVLAHHFSHCKARGGTLQSTCREGSIRTVKSMSVFGCLHLWSLTLQTSAWKATMVWLLPLTFGYPVFFAP